MKRMLNPALQRMVYSLRSYLAPERFRSAVKGGDNERNVSRLGCISCGCLGSAALRKTHFGSK